MSGRPKGLKRSKQEKDKEEEVEEKQSGGKRVRIGESSKAEEEGDQLRLVVEGGEDEDGHMDDDFDQAKAIYQSAMQLIEDDNVERASTLLNGAVHELDRLLKEGTHASISTPEFFRFYGEVLCQLGMLQKSPEFLVEAIDRYDSALEIDANHLPSLWETAKTYAQLIYLENQDDEATKERNAELKAAFNKFVERVEPIDPQRNQERITMARFIQSLAMTLTSHPNYLLNNLAISLLDKLDTPETKSSHEALATKARCLMSMGAEKFEDNKKKAAREMLKEACELLEKSLEVLQAAGPSDAEELLATYHSLHGEALVHFANTLSEEEAAKVYETAVAKLKEAKRISPDVVPEALTQFIHDWESGEGGEGQEEQEGQEDDEESGDEEQEEDQK